MKLIGVNFTITLAMGTDNIDVQIGSTQNTILAQLIIDRSVILKVSTEDKYVGWIPSLKFLTFYIFSFICLPTMTFL